MAIHASAGSTSSAALVHGYVVAAECASAILSVGAILAALSIKAEMPERSR
jgi:hypothetical protein